MKTNYQLIDLVPIPTFLIDKNSFEIVSYNEKGLILTHLSGESLKKCKISAFINQNLIKVGEYENCSFKINKQNCLLGNLTVQIFNKENLIVSFWNNSKTDVHYDDNYGNESLKGIFHISKTNIDLSTDSIFIMQNGIIEYVNPNLLEVSGYKLSELIGLKYTEFVSPKELEKVYSFFLNREKSVSIPTKYESIVKLRNGKLIDVEVSVINIIFEEKHSLQVGLKDITKRKVAERKHQNIIDFAPIGFYQSTREGNFITVNNELVNILGFENSKELISKNISEFYFSTEEREKLIAKYDSQNKSREKNVEIKFKKKDGNPIWVLMTARAIKDNNQLTLYYDGFIIDNTKRKKKENTQKILLNLSKKSFANIGLKEYLELIHNELKQVMKADNFYVALYNKTTDKYSFPYSVDPFHDGNYDSSVSLHHSLTNMVREAKQGQLVTKKTIDELHEKHQLKIAREISAVWLGVPLIDSSNNEAIGVLVLQDYKYEKAYDEEDLQTLEIIASNVGLFIERVKNQEKLKLAKIAAEEGEKKYKSLFYDNNSVMILVDPITGDIFDANKSACDYYGYSYKQLTTLKIQQINNFSEKEVKAEMHKALNEESKHFYFKHRLANGEIKDVEVYSGIVNISGKDLIYSIVHDIGKRKLAEEKVLKLSTSIEQSPISIVITDLKGVIEYVNPYYSELTGYSIEELIGNNPRIVNSGVQNNAFYKELWNTILAGDKWQGNICNKKKNGNIFWERAIVSPIKNKDGEITHFVGIKEDITEKIKIEKELKFLANALEQVGECVSITDKYDILLYVNKSFCKTFGYTKNELLGKHISILHPTEIVQSQVKDILSGKMKDSWKGELINKRKDGTVFPIFLSTSVIEDDNHNKIAFIGITMDMTEMKKNRNELIAAKEKAVESDRLKSAFLANMSHEIRTPMNGILGFSNLLKKPDLTSEKQQEYIKIIEKGGARMLNIINDIVSISKIESGQMEVRIQESNINEQVEYIYTFFKPEIENKGLQFSFRNSLPSKEAILKTDREKVFAILTNLVKNAIKYTSEGSIEFGYILKKDTETGSNKLCRDSEVEFYVKDTGIGIPKERQQAIFERFIQADIKDKNAYQGAGLGLSISKAYVEMLGGKFWVESEEGLGSIFYFTLPYQIQSKEKLMIKKAFPIVGEEPIVRNLKILIAEDDKASEVLISILLEDVSNEILKARTGKETVEICRNNVDIDLILMDIQMPDINGYEATRQIRKFNKEVIIIAQTAYGLTGDREKSIEAGCNEYITKPIIKEKLFALIQKTIKIN